MDSTGGRKNPSGMKSQLFPSLWELGARGWNFLPSRRGCWAPPEAPEGGMVLSGIPVTSVNPEAFQSLWDFFPD